MFRSRGSGLLPDTMTGRLPLACSHRLSVGVRNHLEDLLGLLYPNRCLLCDGEPASARGGYVGSRCRRSVRAIHPPYCSQCGLPFPADITGSFVCTNCEGLSLAFESARAAVVAGGVVLEVIHRFKYARALWFEPFLSDLLLTAAVPALAGGGWTAVVPVPLHPVRARHREFNQAERLARPLAAALGLPLLCNRVRRTMPTLTQTHLSRAERARNVNRAFQPGDGGRLDGASVVIVDDVLTTGATTSATAGVLRRLGAVRVCVWSVARAIRGEPPLA
ncbi:MAG: ComF family protein [Verrucomicrobiae bacterium]|nr:ComF family protein [Verrucomicrobiae bacterium]